MIRITFLLFIIIGSYSHIFCQPVITDKSFHFKHLSLEEGLPQPSVYALLQDTFGYIWVATADGVAKYDGYAFKLYRQSDLKSRKLASNRTTALAEDSHGNIWISSDKGGLSMWHLDTDRIVQVNYLCEAEEIKSAFCYSMCRSRDSWLWLATNKRSILF
ncbi:MAG: two-component regulator propeller domain-containing protein [Bacteroidota bacterium]